MFPLPSTFVEFFPQLDLNPVTFINFSDRDSPVCGEHGERKKRREINDQNKGLGRSNDVIGVDERPLVQRRNVFEVFAAMG
jgi:hypothetical protein